MKHKLVDFTRNIEVKNATQFYLDDILTEEDYKTMMVKKRIVVLNKTECGNGGTSGIVNFIQSDVCKRGALILVPNRSIVISKEESYMTNPDICCVYGGKDEINLSARIVIATYDQFNRLMNTLDCSGQTYVNPDDNIFNGKFWGGRVIVVDEYHKLVDESKFRDVMVGVTDLIVRTDEPVVLMSATPHHEYVKAITNVLYEKKNVVPMNISYKMTHKDVRVDENGKEVLTKMDIAIRKRLEEASRRMVKSMSIYEMNPYELPNFFKWLIDGNKKVCVFYNNVSKMSQILKSIGTDECEILCSSDEKQKKKCDKYYSDKYDESKRVHFMTSAYFTGHDIDEEIDECYIIGSRRASNTAISMRDIKQIIGRFREYCGWSWSGINIMYLNESKKDEEYESVDKQLNETEYWLNKCGDDWVNDMEAIKMMLNNLKYRDIKRQFDYWSTPAKLINELRANGYEVFTAVVDGKRVDKPKAMGELPDYTALESLSYREAFIKIANGEEVDWREYPDVNKIIEYITLFDVSRTKRGKVIVPPRDKVFDYVDFEYNLADIKSEFEQLSPDDRYIAFGFEDCATYKAKKLLNALKYTQEICPNLVKDELNDGVLPIKFREVFGALMYFDKEGRTKGSDLWSIIGHYMFDRMNEFTSSDDKSTPPHTILREFSYIESLTEKCSRWSKNEMKLSYMNRKQPEVQKDGSVKNRCMAKTISFGDIEDVLSSLKGNRIYDWVNEDKKVRIYKMKMEIPNLDSLKEKISNWKDIIESGDKLSAVETKIYNKISNKTEHELKIWYRYIKDKQDEWKSLKNNQQLKISELYRDTDAEYRHTKGDMNMISCLICDIDSGLPFSEFKDIYKQYKWYAYPTISNTNPIDWNKYRIIVPLPKPVRVDGENNVKVLKALRSMFCPYEDTNHRLPSYINLDDFEHMYENEGEFYNIRQKEVDLLQHLTSVMNTYTTTDVNMTDTPIIKNGCSNDMLISGTIKMLDNCKENWNTTIYNRLWKLVTINGFGRKEIDEIKAGLTNRELADYMENTVIRSHPEWKL